MVNKGGRPTLQGMSMVANAVSAVILAASCAGCAAFSIPAAPLALRCSSKRDVTPESGAYFRGAEAATSLGRRAFLLGAGLAAGATPAFAADIFGTGAQIGWGEKQKAGISWDGGFANPLSSQPNEFAFEVVNGQGSPVVIAFEKPKKWKVSTNAGITIQDYISTDSGFVLVAPSPKGNPDDISSLDAQYALDKVFDIRGRYGTYGKVDTITITKKKVVEEGGRQYKYIDFKFSTLSPGSREIERNGCVKVTSVDGDLIMLVASSNSNRWKSVKETIAATISTFSVAKTPKTAMKQIESGIGNLAALGVAGYDLLRFDSPIWTSRSSM